MTGVLHRQDGIHGATFSSEALHEGSPATAVQIGDPITQKMADFLLEARDLGLYTCVTDDGAVAACPPVWAKWRASREALPYIWTRPR